MCDISAALWVHQAIDDAFRTSNCSSVREITADASMGSWSIDNSVDSGKDTADVHSKHSDVWHGSELVRAPLNTGDLGIVILPIVLLCRSGCSSSSCA